MHAWWILIFCHAALLAFASKQCEICAQHTTVFAAAMSSEQKEKIRKWIQSTWHHLWHYAVMQCSICSWFFFLFIFLFFTGSVWTSTASLMYRFTSTHVAIVWFITRLAAAATDWYHPLSIPVTVELYGHVYFLSVGNTTSPSDD